MQASNNCHDCGNHVQNAENVHGSHNRHVHGGHHKHAGFGKFMEQAQKEETQERPAQPQDKPVQERPQPQARPEQPQARPEQPQAQHEHSRPEQPQVMRERVVYLQPMYCHPLPLHHVNHVHYVHPVPVHNVHHAHHGHHAHHMQLHGNGHSKGGSEDSNDLIKIMKSIAKMMQSGELTMQDLKDAEKDSDKKDSSSIKQILEEFWNMVKNDEKIDIADLLSKIKQQADEEGKTEQSVA